MSFRQMYQNRQVIILNSYLQILFQSQLNNWFIHKFIKNIKFNLGWFCRLIS
jgi:hypothetical protein